MASNRSNATSPAATRAASPAAPWRALAGVARHGARIEIAAFVAGSHALAGWAHAADRLAQALGDALLDRVEGQTDSGELIVGVASATHVHLHELATLPGAAADHFDARLTRVSTNQ